LQTALINKTKIIPSVVFKINETKIQNS